MKNTEGTVVVQKPGYCDNGGNVLKPELATSIDVTSDEVATGSNKPSDPVVTACAHVRAVAHEALAPTCVKEGTEAYWECPDCGKLFADASCKQQIDKPVAIEKTNHVPGPWVHDANGHWRECTTEDCDARVEVGAHAYGDWSVVREPTAGVEGVRQRVCVTCGMAQTSSIAALPDVAKHKVTFVLGSDAQKVVEVEDGKLVSKPIDPSRDGCVFVGWFLTNIDGKLSDEFDFSKPITSDITVYAGYIKDGEDGIKPQSDSRPALPQTGDISAALMLVASATGMAAVAAGSISKRKQR